ncbi:MAG TPA: S49 family peptidase [Acetobacteraceae bacterium]|nr:S49 family peptidase [Acetobacteraceae bacterium]
MRLAFWRRDRRVPVIELHGLIAARMGQLNLAGTTQRIEAAFAAAKGRPVVLDIDSPGGSPVQSDLIASAIRRRADRARIEVHAVIQDVGASGGYWIACAADRIWANPMSIVGSIGVRGGGFGFPQLLQRLGVERRLYTAGVHKARLDPFLPEDPDDVAFTQRLLDDLHARFKGWVEERRGARLTDPASVFDGSFMLADRGKALGLIDGFGDVESVVREIGGDKAKPRWFRPKPRGLLRRIPGLAADALLDAIEERRWHISLLP